MYMDRLSVAWAKDFIHLFVCLRIFCSIFFFIFSISLFFQSCFSCTFSLLSSSYQFIITSSLLPFFFFFLPLLIFFFCLFSFSFLQRKSDILQMAHLKIPQIADAHTYTHVHKRKIGIIDIKN